MTKIYAIFTGHRLAIVALAHFCGAPRGQKDLAAFAKRMTQGQRHALGIRRNRRTGKYPSPSQPTFCRLLRGVDPLKVEEAILAFQEQIRGVPVRDEVVAMDGKELKHSRGQQILTAVGVPSQYYLASVPVAEKSNEIPAARELIERLDLEGRPVGLDALHTQVETACTDEINRKRREIRRIWTIPVTPEQVCFPGARQAARLERQIGQYHQRRGFLLVSARPPSL